MPWFQNPNGGYTPTNGLLPPFGGWTQTIATTSTSGTSTLYWINDIGTGGTQYLSQTLSSTDWYQTQLAQPLFRPAAPNIIRRRNVGDQAAQPAPPVNPTHQANQQRIQAAKERAHELLMNHLSPEQRKTFDKHHWFVVEGGKSKQKYKVHCRSGMSGNIEVVGKLYRLCAHLSGDIPIGDQLLAQKVMLELDEDHFVHTANVHPIYA